MRRTPRLIAAAAVASALIFSACGSSDSAPKQRNSAIAQPGEGLKIAVYNMNQADVKPENFQYYGNGSESLIQRYDDKHQPCEGSSQSIANINHDWGDGTIEGCGSEFVLVHYYGFIEIPGEKGGSKDVTFDNVSDDGFYMTIGGKEVLSDWRIKPCSGVKNTVNLETGRKLFFDAWFFEYRGGACNSLYWQMDGIEREIVPPSAFSIEDLSSEDPETTDETTTTIAGGDLEMETTTTSAAPAEGEGTGTDETTTTVASADKQVIVDDTTPITVPAGDTSIACDTACVESIRTTLGVTGDVYATVAGEKVLLDGKTAIPTNGTEVVFSDGANKSITVAFETLSEDTVADDSFNNTPADDSSFPWWIVIVAVVVLAGGGYTAARKKKKS